MDDYSKYKHGLKQAKLDSVDFLMVILTRLKICPEHQASRIYQDYRQEIFYRYNTATIIHPERTAKIYADRIRKEYE